MKILVTGGAGYIGSHACVELLKAGHDVTVFDNFCNSQPEAVRRIERITGRRPALVRGDIREQSMLETVIRDHRCEAVMHFAGLKAVGESMEKPELYHDNNVTGSQRLLEAMEATGIKTIIFSSSATVYGVPQTLPYKENHPLGPINVYGETKLAVENLLHTKIKASPDWRIAILRYFNPVGAHESGLIGEDPRGIPQNLMPFVAQVAVGKRDKLLIYGDDYDTADGTGVRDYIHVVDLALGHVAALDYLSKNAGLITTNLGTGKGQSVLELVHAFEKASNKKIAKEVVKRRAGDLPAYWADPSYATKILNWQATRDLKTMCEDVWRWQSNNPEGYQTN